MPDKNLLFAAPPVIDAARVISGGIPSYTVSWSDLTGFNYSHTVTTSGYTDVLTPVYSPIGQNGSTVTATDSETPTPVTTSCTS